MSLPGLEKEGTAGAREERDTSLFFQLSDQSRRLDGSIAKEYARI